MRILFAGGGTGGHLYPGLAIARALVRQEPGARPFFVGARRGVERDVLPDCGFPYLLLDLHPLYRSRPWENWRTAVGLTSAWRALGKLVREERPAVAVGTGGYASGATLAYAAAHGIPFVLQEQNSHPGMTTRLFARRAREVYLGYGEAARMLSVRPGAWIGETGNPITPPPAPRPDRSMARSLWRVPEEARVLLIVGGSQGARALNEVVDAWLSRGIPENLFVIWATGKASHERHAAHESAYVRVVPYLAPIEEAYAASDLAVTRAGALTLAELCAWGIPSVLVPLPTAAADHQSSNARALAATGAAVVIPQSEFTTDRLDRTLRELLGQPERLSRIAAAARSRARPDAAETIARRILTLAHFKQLQT
ncbi:MAG TPA: UDP-N-acetylglucosamine--N-acetylmuramyl-(pentapeptide) pyrophosphoryl-undecaprenol N-acetylglucosamine transferase [Gemmatimonadaceae bacterium]|nr:UDP-N-acetylglucosamine--N-acetylmuramyl-(pentapeptide) pyrophosphoryl-undecaprenol N-acetylglucosamine transferase [Gemmatimonadaceae bacterium]